MTTVAPAVPCAPVRGRLSHEPAEPARAPRTSPNFTDTDYRRTPYIADSLADDFKETPWR